MYTGHIGTLAFGLGSTGLGDGLGFFFPGMDQLISKVMNKEPPPVEKKSTPSFTICPPDMRPNPQWAAIPEESRGQAAASGVQACLPDPTKKKGKPKCMIMFGSGKYKCNQGDFARAYNRAQRSAAKKPTGKSSVRMQIGSQTIIIPVRSGAAAAGAALPGAVPGMPSYPGAVVPAQYNPTTGAFTCTPPLRSMQNAQGQVVCVDPSTLAQQPGATAASSRFSSRRSPRGRGGRTSRRGGRLRDGLGFIHYPGDYQMLEWRQQQYGQALARQNVRGPAYQQVVNPAWKAAIPRWMARQLPNMSLSDAFGGY